MSVRISICACGEMFPTGQEHLCAGLKKVPLPKTQPTYTQSQVEAIVKADRERLIKEVDDWLCDCKKLQPYVLEHHHFNCALGYALIRIRTTPIEIGEGE